ncbi:MAG: hypothetical protein DRO87_12420 [Candidatus Thorarchaeota archaeon]|nr:MAG: hypothetical protein DRO87_12420 [Candidatus Thorarchaeota archaeon]
MLVPKWGPHADKAKRQRGITEQEIARAWLFGIEVEAKDGKRMIIGPEVSLIMANEFIVTMFPTKYKDRFAARRAAYKAKHGLIGER